MDEEPCDGKLSCTVLKTSRKGDLTAEFNSFVEDCIEKPGIDQPWVSGAAIIQ
jgi:hypothetical protein